MRALIPVTAEFFEVIINFSLALVEKMQGNGALGLFDDTDIVTVDTFKPAGELVDVGDRRRKP